MPHFYNSKKFRACMINELVPWKTYLPFSSIFRMIFPGFMSLCIIWFFRRYATPSPYQLTIINKSAITISTDHQNRGKVHEETSIFQLKTLFWISLNVSWNFVYWLKMDETWFKLNDIAFFSNKTNIPIDWLSTVMNTGADFLICVVISFDIIYILLWLIITYVM